jgi:c-di-GMP-binding flagellar brake protein YcgR
MSGTMTSTHGAQDAAAPVPAPAADSLPDIGENRDVATLLDVAYPMQRVRIRWHTLDGGEVAVPGQIQTVEGQTVTVWFDRNAPSYNPLHSDDQVWIDTLGEAETYVYAAWITGMRPPDTMVVLVQGLPRKDQRRQYVRERVGLPPLPMVPVNEHGDPAGDMQEVTVTDLSGGGIRLEIERPVEQDQSIAITMDLGDEPFEVIVTIVESVTTIKGRQIVRGYFSEIPERCRRDIIRFVFREQIRKSRLAPP